ncbi:MAG: beta-ketoacyl synthase chain length factor, partial [Pseudomonadota bacterium]
MSDAIAILGAGICSLDPGLPAQYGLDGGSIDPAALPTHLRRRASQATKMAVTAARRACQNAHAEAKNLPSVFASAGGEIQVTDALCLALPDPNGYISPTQFHNSVHNTTAGYWSILNDCNAPTTAIAASEETVAMAFLEAWCMLRSHPGKVRIVC